MKVHYINILLFALPLNILVTLYQVYSKNKPSITHHTPTNRSLCECDIYMPNYDNDSQMKSVMENFNKQTQQRFEEYDERMQNIRQKCKDKCDKEIEKIILKDKLEKELMDKFSTLHTDIQSDAIPTCICEKSLADKVEKTCLKCTQNFGGIVAPSSGVLAGIAEGALIVWKPLAIEAAEKAAVTEATVLATKAGMDAVISKIKVLINLFAGDTTFDLTKIVTTSNYKCGTVLVQTAKEVFGEACINPATRGGRYGFCNTAIYMDGSEYYLENIAKVGAEVYEKTLASETATLTGKKVGAVNTGFESSISSINAAIIAIVIIILIMVIIYLILRHRRKKKMKKKLQYIKLLEE